jgi:hypothetical protein
VSVEVLFYNRRSSGRSERMAKGTRNKSVKRNNRIKKKLCEPFERQKLEALSKKMQEIIGTPNEAEMIGRIFF